MKSKQIHLRLTKDQYLWLKNYAMNLGETMNTIIRTALNEYKNRLK